MRTTFHLRRARRGTLATLALCACLSAHAQFGGGGMHGGMGRGGGQGRASTEQAPSGPTLPDQLYQARIRLLITSAQAAAWERFYGDVLALGAGAAAQPSGDLANASQAIQLQLAYAQRRATLTEKLAASWQALSAQLDDQQKEAADLVIPPLLVQAAESTSRFSRAGGAR
jgi:hypothetical protein